MNGPSPGFRHARRWLQQLRLALLFKPRSSDEMTEMLRVVRRNSIFDSQVLDILEGALRVGDMQVGEIMVPRPQITALKYDQSARDLLTAIIESGHSRFPVIGDSVDDIKGILLAKQLLPLLLKGQDHITHAQIDRILLPAHIVPETKHVNDLLREFREKRNHMAIVVDEYGGVSGLVTIEDILEEIVGDIEDETDEDEDEQFIRKLNPRDYLVKALTPIETFNTHFNTSFSNDEYDTIGGLLMKQFGHLPRRNEMATLDHFRFRVISADKRQVHLLRMTVSESLANPPT